MSFLSAHSFRAECTIYVQQQTLKFCPVLAQEEGRAGSPDRCCRVERHVAHSWGYDVIAWPFPPALVCSLTVPHLLYTLHQSHLRDQKDTHHVRQRASFLAHTVAPVARGLEAMADLRQKVQDYDLEKFPIDLKKYKPIALDPSKDKKLSEEQKKDLVRSSPAFGSQSLPLSSPTLPCSVMSSSSSLRPGLPVALLVTPGEAAAEAERQGLTRAEARTTQSPRS